MADVELVTADGTVYPLTAAGSGLQHLGDKLGRLLPPVRTRYENIAANPGQRLVDVQLDAREVTVPVAIMASSPATVRATARTWATRLDPTKGDLALRINDVAPARELVCRYVGGLAGAETWDAMGYYSLKGLLILRSESPYWRALADSSVAFTNTGDTGTPWFPIFPLVFGAGSTLTGGTVTNGGDVDTWPTFVCSGPFTGLTLRNKSTGRAVTTSASASAGETITVVTDPANRSIMKGGTNIYSTLTVTEWWPLVPGTNAVSIEGGGGFDTGTAAVVSWRDLYLSV